MEKKHLDTGNKMEAKILIWNVDSIRDFKIKSYFIQILYENNKEIAMLQETMLASENKFFIKGYKIYKASAKSRKGVAIIVSNQIDCDSYKTIEDLEGRYLQIKLKKEDNLITIGTAYVEPQSEDNNEILLENVFKS